MPAVAEPVRGFALSDFDGPGQPADNPTLDQSTGKVIDPPPAPDRTETPAAPEPEPDPEKTTPDAPERPENEPTDKKVDEDEDEPPTSINDALDEQERAGSDEAKAKAAADKKAADNAAAEKAKAEVEKPAEAKERDADLKPELGPHVRPSTRKIITEMQAKASAARDKEEAANARAEAAEAKAREFEEKSKSVEPPKELVEENKRLLERVRELDITKDPVLEQKYDRKIEANNKSIVEVLKAQGYGMIKKEGSEEMVENPKAIAELLRSGLTHKNLQPLIKKLEDAGLIDESETIRESLRENGRLVRDKQTEVESWKGDYQKRQQVREQETKQQGEKRQAEFRQQTDLQLNAELDELAKNFSYVKKPAAPLPTDTPATAQAKNAQIAEYEAARKQIETAVNGLNPASAPPEKFAEVVGRINALAIQAIVHKAQVFPRVLKELAAREQRIKELEGRLGKIENAGKLSRTQSASTEERNANSGRPEATDLMDALGSGPQ